MKSTIAPAPFRLIGSFTIAILLGLPPLLRASATDDRIETAAQASYVFKTFLGHDQILAKSLDGVVTLTGMVETQANSQLAQATIASLPDVVRVDNQLRTREDSPRERSDGWLAIKVKSVLLFHRNVSARETKVSVREGIVTLRGEATSLAQSELSAEYALDVDGVKEVMNEMTIAKTPVQQGERIDEMIDDASITAQVKSALLWHLSTSSVKTNVATKDGTVTVSGIAKNDAERSLVTKLATDINGVMMVINEMTIAP
jgi:hyperosmotically inducible protein